MAPKACPRAVGSPAGCPGRSLNRRWFLVTAAASTTALAGVLGSRDARAIAPPDLELLARRALTGDERAVIASATERLIPSDDTGPGAREAAVVDFIDRQLAGPFGRAEDWYMQGPFEEGTPEQGYQLRLTPLDLYRLGVANLDGAAKKGAARRGFAALAPDAQDTLLRELEDGKLDGDDFPGAAFFDMLHQNTIEGFFADPIYGGNRGFAGWNLIGYPGTRYDWRPWVQDHNQRLDLPTTGILGPAEGYQRHNG